METNPPVVLNAVPPYGHVIAGDRWRDTSLADGLKGI